MKINWHIIIVVCLLSLSSSVLAKTSNSLKRSFNNAYKSYQYAVEKRQLAEAIAYAKESLELGEQIYGDDALNTANLKFNLAQAQIEAGELQPAYNLLKQVEINYEKRFGQDALELVNVYIAMSNASPYSDKAKLLKKAMRIGRKASSISPEVAALINLEVGRTYLDLGFREAKVLTKAKHFFDKNTAPNDIRRIQTNFAVGKYYLARKDYTKSIRSFNENIEVFQSLSGPNHPLELSTRAFLVDAYEKVGDSKSATEHCIAIGKMRPWLSNQTPTPLFRVHPQFPKRATNLARSGFVQLEFTVDKTGVVKDPVVVGSKGGKMFEKEALKAVSRWRYAPKFENGEAVLAKTQVQLDFRYGD